MYINPFSHKKTILLTGASGVVGQALLDRMNAHSIICLTYRKPITNSGVTTIPCDISLPQLGLSQTQLKDIAKCIDCIVHSAAVTDFGESDELIRSTNVRGLENMLELAAIAQVPFYYISTAFIRPHQRKDAPSEHTYTISKREGERLVRDSGLPHAIIRPSIVIGDSTSGEIARFQGIYNIISSLFRGFLPILPMLPHAYIDFIPQDVVANAIAAIIEHDGVAGEYWITSGNKALTVRQIADLIAEFGKTQGIEINIPRMVSPDIVDRLIRPAFMSELPKSVKKGFDWFAQVAPYLCNEEPFPTSLPEIETGFGIAPLPNLETALTHSLEYWANETKVCSGKKAKKDRAQLAKCEC
ncbi:SDR family oxidoreductase [Fortiea contorta]|uniref:SDR family oxidoreductase n=1 Tax=Fortiea contorta TaxID=1892405 RepID=UPI00034D7086|nr:SDR family oxidoreductase [Fortiea contorta]